VFVNVAGGVRIDEPGADLAVALAVASAARGVALGPPEASHPLAAFGEVGLTGELRSVGHPDRRLAEARKFGLATVVAPGGAGAGEGEATTLRAAVKAALPAAVRPRAA
jgi:DNA repair protein RadA/Sms